MKNVLIVFILALLLSVFAGCQVIDSTTSILIDQANKDVQILAERCLDPNNVNSCEDCKDTVRVFKVNSQNTADLLNGRRVSQ
jgi:hypothetical protein